MKRAFSLIELIVVIGIISLLTVISIAGFTAQQKKARDSRRIADIGSLGLAIENYRTIKNAYPSQNGTGPDGNLITTNLDVLVNEGLVNILPTEPRPVTGPELFCSNYTYAKDWDFNGVSDTDLGYWFEPVGYTNKQRAYALYARTEQAGTATGRHVQDSSLYATPGLSWCTRTSGYAILSGPKT
jgi:prepilin-type N-terminal cleavage/methylation domain-containing protein